MKKMYIIVLFIMMSFVICGCSSDSIVINSQKSYKQAIKSCKENNGIAKIKYNDRGWIIELTCYQKEGGE